MTAPRRRRRRRRKEVGSFRGGRGGREEKHLFPPSFRLTKLNFFFLSYRPSFPPRESGRILHFESRWREEERLKVGESHLLLFPSLHTAPFPEKGSFENGLYCRKERRTRGKRFLPSPSSFLPFNKKVKLRESSVTHSCFFSAVSSTLFHPFPPWLLPFFPLLPPTRELRKQHFPSSRFFNLLPFPLPPLFSNIFAASSSPLAFKLPLSERVSLLPLSPFSPDFFSCLPRSCCCCPLESTSKANPLLPRSIVLHYVHSSTTVLFALSVRGGGGGGGGGAKRYSLFKH